MPSCGLLLSAMPCLSLCQTLNSVSHLDYLVSSHHDPVIEAIPICILQTRKLRLREIWGFAKPLCRLEGTGSGLPLGHTGPGAPDGSSCHQTASTWDRPPHLGALARAVLLPTRLATPDTVPGLSVVCSEGPLPAARPHASWPVNAFEVMPSCLCFFSLVLWPPG